MSQEDYLGPQRGRTDLGSLVYTHPKPTKEFRTLPLTPQFKDESPAGNQHLRYESGATSIGRVSNRQNWDLAYSVGGGVYYTVAPKVYLSRDDVVSLCTVTDDGCVPSANKWLVLRSTDIDFATAEILLVSNWTGEGYPSIYEFDVADPFSFTTVSFPLWQFVSAATAAASVDTFIQFSDDVYGKKLVPSSPLKLGYVLVKVPSQPVLRSAPELYA
jgi:hypothetical protein